MKIINDILKTTSFTGNHKLYLIASVTIPFFLCFRHDKQSEMVGLSLRTIYRIKEDLIEASIINKLDTRTHEINYKILKEKL